MILRECLNYWLRRYGEPFQVGAQTQRGIFFQPSAGLLRWHFSSEELAGLPRPLWAVAVAPSTNLTPNTTLTWRSATYRVRKQIEFRLGAEAVYRVAVIEPVNWESPRIASAN